LMAIALVSGIVSYFLWALSQRPASGGRGHLIWTTLLVGLIALRYSRHLSREGDGDPAEILLRDRVLAILFMLLGSLLIGLVYGRDLSVWLG